MRGGRPNSPDAKHTPCGRARERLSSGEGPAEHMGEPCFIRSKQIPPLVTFFTVYQKSLIFWFVSIFEGKKKIIFLYPSLAKCAIQ